jgi:hypothetical protein
MWPSLPAARWRARPRTSTRGARAPHAALRPFRIDSAFPADGSGERRQREARIRVQLDLAAAIFPQLVRVVGDPDPARIRKNGGRAVAHLVVELAAHGDDEVRLLHRSRTHRADVRSVRARDEAAAFLGVEIERAARIEETHELGRIAHCAAARDHQEDASPSR